MKAWTESEEFKKLSATAPEFYKTKIDTKANRYNERQAEKLENRLVRRIRTNLDDSDMKDTDPVWIKVQNNDIIDVTKNEIKQRNAAEMIVNSDEGQDMLR